MQKSVAIIGGGISGLTAGIYSLLAGFKVQLFESQSSVGGMCATWKRKGVDCFTPIHWMMGGNQFSHLYHIWRDLDVIEESTDCIVLDYLSSIRLQDGFAFLYSDLEKLENELLRISPSDVTPIKELVSEISLYKNLPIPAEVPDDLMTLMQKALQYSPYLKAEKKSSLKGISIREYVRRFESPDIRLLLSTVFPDDRFHVRKLVMWMAAAANKDIVYPKGGFSSIVDRMLDKFSLLGGELHLNSNVGQIIVDENSAKGIRVDNGEIINSDYVISTVSPDVLLGCLLEGKYKDSYFESRFNCIDRYCTPTLSAINFSVSSQLRGYPHTLIVEVDNKGNQFDSSYLKINHFSFSRCLDVSQRNLMQVVIPDYGYGKWKELKNRSSELYSEVKSNLVNAVISTIEAVYPGLNGKIDLLDMLTPVTIERYCRSYRGAYLPFGNITNYYEASNHPGRIEGVNNLFLAGQWVSQDGGLPMAAIAGKFAVQRMINSENIHI